MGNPKQACRVLLTTCSNCQKHENILFVTDMTSLEVALTMWKAAKDFPNKSMIMMGERTMHGQEPTAAVSSAMMASDIIFGCTKFSLMHSEARRQAVKSGARFVNMVDYNMSMLDDGGLMTDFYKQGVLADKIAADLVGDYIRITSLSGTDLTARISKRPACPQYARSLQKGTSSSPPDIECAIAPIEDTSKGLLIIDGSIPHPDLGLIRDVIVLTLDQGRITNIEGGQQAQVLKSILESFNDPNAYVLGEIGIGLNDKCSLNGRMLEDEGCLGTVHFGFGSNTSFFGSNTCNYHLDMVIRKPSVSVDDICILDQGTIV
jgi:leucyl aminopeptidase (aminopeptidase T)